MSAYQKMAALPINEARKVWISRVLSERGRVQSLRKSLLAEGYEHVGVGPDQRITRDGREIVWAGGEAWALRPDIHAARLAAAFEATKKAKPEFETKSVVGTEALSQIVCPKCGDALQHTAVCPKCAVGKLGYRHRYTCVCGGVDMISKEAL